MIELPKKTPLPTMDGPSSCARNITPSADNFPRPAQKMWIGGGGDMTVLLLGDTEPVTIRAIPAGTLFERINIVAVTEATATDIVAFF